MAAYLFKDILCDQPYFCNTGFAGGRGARAGEGQGSGKWLVPRVKGLIALQVFTQYREHGVMMWRGYTILQMAHQARGSLHTCTAQQPRPPRHTYVQCDCAATCHEQSTATSADALPEQCQHTHSVLCWL